MDWTEQDIGSQPAVTSIWRVGEWFVAVGRRAGLPTTTSTVDAAFIRSRDGRDWESVPAPARGLEVETGTVDDNVLWIVGRLGSSADPKRGIWTTRDGASWQRVADVTGLDFGPGRVNAQSHTRAPAGSRSHRVGSTQSRRRAFLLRSADGVAWTKPPYPDGAARYAADGLASDGERWLMVTARSPGTGSEIWALSSTNGTDWIETRIAAVARGPGAPAAVEPGAVAFGPGGFVVVGQQLEGEFPHPDRVGLPRRRDMDGRPRWMGCRIPRARPGCDRSSSSTAGYFASGYRLDDDPSFWTSVDGSSWAQVDDLFGSDPAYVQAIAASDSAYVAGGQTSDGGPFLWSAPH